MSRRTPYNDKDPNYTPILNYVCLDYNGKSSANDSFPDRVCPDGLRVQLTFPSCWDGKDMDSNNHEGHMSYATWGNLNHGPCPDTHPVRLPELFTEVNWQTHLFSSYPEAWKNFIWSFNDTTGYGYHGDFINGWNVTALQTALDMGCEELETCPPFHFRNTQYAQKCGLKNLKGNMPYVQERVLGVLPELIIGAGSQVTSINPYGAINAYAAPPNNSTLPQINYGPDKNGAQISDQ